MDLTVRIEPLEPAQIELAYPLAQTIAADLTLERWRGYARAMAASREPYRHGIMGAWTSAGYLHGMFGYRVAADLILGRVLQVDNFVAMGIGSGPRAATALIGAVRTLAAAEDCGAVQALVAPAFAPLFDSHGLVPVLSPPSRGRVLWRSWLLAQERQAASPPPEER